MLIFASKSHMNLLGVDVGFSKERKTTGLAWRIGGAFGVGRTGTSWEIRKRQVPHVPYSVAAFDAPIIPQHEGCPYRECERLFYGGPFWNRCRPGLSHREKRGLPLRQAGADAASQFVALVSGSPIATEIAVRAGTGIIEAFPNAFLGVLIPDESYKNSDRREGEHKSDWMYRKVAEQGTLKKLLSKLDWTGHDTVKVFAEQAGPHGNHEIRAALVCLMTAGFAASSAAVTVGTPAHGWFWLPPWKFWEHWAQKALESQLQRLITERASTIVRWSGPTFR